MALNEGSIFLLRRSQSLEFGILKAVFIVNQMLGDVILEKSLQNVQLIVVFEMELLTFLSLMNVISLVLVAILDYVLIQLLHSLNLIFQNDAIF
jgi:hypothetical protein